MYMRSVSHLLVYLLLTSTRYFICLMGGSFGFRLNISFRVLKLGETYHNWNSILPVSLPAPRGEDRVRERIGEIGWFHIGIRHRVETDAKEVD